MNLRTKAPISLVVAASCIFGGTGYVCYHAQNAYIENNKKAKLDEIGEQLKSGVDGLNRSAKIYGELIASMPDVQRALKADDREALAELLEPTFKLMQNRYGAEAGNFQRELPAHKDPHTGQDMAAGLYSILRLANLSNRGEYDQSKRDMVVRANHQHETQAGLEVMSTATNVRAVAPVGSGSEHYGSFEYGVGFGRLFDTMKTRLHADLALFVDEKTIPPALTAQGAANAREAQKAAESERVAEGYRTIASTNPEVMKLVVTTEFLASIQAPSSTREVEPTKNGKETGSANGNANEAHDDASGAPKDHSDAKASPAPAAPGKGQPVTRELTASDSRYGIVGVPLFDFGGRRVGALVGVRNLDDERRVARSTLLNFLGATLVGVILLAGAVQLVFNGLLVRPLVELSENLDKVAGGDVNAKIELASRPDEVGTFAKRLDKLRDKLRLEKEASTKGLEPKPEVKS